MRSDMLTTQDSTKNSAIKMVLWQICLCIVYAGVLCLAAGMQSGWSALLGGMSYCLPNFLFVRRVFAQTTARAATQFVIRFMVGEVAKLFSSAVIFVLVIKYFAVKTIPALSGYIVVIIGFWFISMLFMLREGKVSQ